MRCLVLKSLCDSVLDVENEHIFWLFLLACSTVVLYRIRLNNLIQIRIRLILMSFTCIILKEIFPTQIAEMSLLLLFLRGL